MRFPGGVGGRTVPVMLRGLLLLAFLFAALAVHPCPADPDGAGAHTEHAAGATAAIQHTHHPSAAVAASAASPAVAPAGAAVPCMGGSCASAARQPVGEFALAPVADVAPHVPLTPLPRGAFAPGGAAAAMHSGQSPGAVPERAPDRTLLSVLRT